MRALTALLGSRCRECGAVQVWSARLKRLVDVATGRPCVHPLPALSEFRQCLCGTHIEIAGDGRRFSLAGQPHVCSMGRQAAAASAPVTVQARPAAQRLRVVKPEARPKAASGRVLRPVLELDV